MKLFDPIPLRTIPPNAITATAMAFGLASIHQSLTGEPNVYNAAWFVLISMLLDKLDGSLARAIKGSTEFGVQFDSFADSVAFGAAPAALVYTVATTMAPQVWGHGQTLLGLPAHHVAGGLALAYAVLTAVRLARFNVMTAVLGPYLFLGLPSTLSGGLLASGFLASLECGLLRSWPAFYAWLPIMLLINGLLMVCNLPLPKLKMSKRLPWRVAQIVAAVAIYGVVPLQKGFWVVTVLLTAYLAVGFTYLGPRMWAAVKREAAQPDA